MFRDSLLGFLRKSLCGVWVRLQKSLEKQMTGSSVMECALLVFVISGVLQRYWYDIGSLFSRTHITLLWWNVYFRHLERSPLNFLFLSAWYQMSILKKAALHFKINFERTLNNANLCEFSFTANLKHITCGKIEILLQLYYLFQLLLNLQHRTVKPRKIM